MKMRNLLTRHVNRTLLVVASLIVALLPAQFLTKPHDSNGADRTTPEHRERPGGEASNEDRLSLAEMREQVMDAKPLALYYSAGDTFGLDSVLEHASDMSVLAPQCYWLDQNGKIQGNLPDPVMGAAQKARLPVMALLSNDDFNRQVASAFLRNQHLQKRVIKKLANIARRDNLLGFQLDFENIDPDDKNLYTRFVRDTARELHHDGRLLSVAVVPRFLGSPPGQWSAAYDYSALAHAADFLTLMSYDNSSRLGRPGPIAGYEWVRNAIEYARRRVPTEKLLLGIPLYGREWSDDGRGFQARTMPYPETQALLERLSLKPRWDEKRRSPWFKYTTSGTVRSVWYEDARSIQEKLRLVEEFHLRGFAAWRLGLEDPRIWSIFSAMREGSPETQEHPRAATGF
jgi:spore germination protein YaaH